MPAWAPGAYGIRNEWRNVQEFSSIDEASAPLKFEKVDKQTWRIYTASRRRITARYKLYYRSYNDELCYITGPSVFMYVVGKRPYPLDGPVCIKLDAPAGWRIQTGMEPGKEPNGFVAEDYDTFIDASIALGKSWEQTQFDIKGVPHYIVFIGKGNYDKRKITDDTKAVVDYLAELMGGLPYKKYVFFLRARGGQGSGGLEHLNSTDISFSAYNTHQPESNYKRFMFVVAIRWNSVIEFQPKRIRSCAKAAYSCLAAAYHSLRSICDPYLAAMNAQVFKVFLECPSRHKLSLDYHSFWREAICTKCFVRVDRTRIKRILKCFRSWWFNTPRRNARSGTKSVSVPKYAAADILHNGDVLLTRLQFQTDRLARQAWATKESLSGDFLLDQLKFRNASLDSTIKIILDHARQIAPGLSVPYRIPRVETGALIEAVGHFKVADGYVSVKIGSSFIEDVKVVRAILAHETCHYILENSGIRESDIQANERLTDLCMFVCGLGNLFLDGYERASKRNHYRPGHHLGYLSEAEYNFVATYILELRSTNALHFLRG